MKYLNHNLDNELIFSCGEGYLLCIYKNKNGKSQIYSKGRNDNYQCGINSNHNIPSLVNCEINNNLDFKYVCTYKISQLL